MKTVPRGVIPRSAWGARYDNGFRDRPMPATEIWLHHSVTTAPDTLPPWDDEEAAMREIERIGQNRFGGGFPYSLAVFPSGRVYEGCSIWRQGAHTRGHNTAGVGVVLVGNYDTTPMPQQMVTATAQLMVILHRDGHTTRHTLTGAHSDVYATACPGRYARGKMTTVNLLAAALWDENTSRGRFLSEDGIMDAGTVRIVQKFLAVPSDGVWGRDTTIALQHWVRTVPDGHLGPRTIRALQSRLGIRVTGSWNMRGIGDPTTRAFEQYLNRGIKAGSFRP